MNSLELADILKRLGQAHKDASTESERRRRPIDVQKPEDSGWVLHERLAMHKATNEERARLGKPPVSLESVRKKELTSAGHVDFAHKFALGCRDLVLES